MKKYFTKAVFVNILITMVIFGLLLLLVQFGLKSYTRHGEEITIPDLNKKSVTDAIKKLEDLGLDWVVLDSVFSKDYPPMSVVDLFPKAGNKVKNGRKVYITVNASNPPMVEVPYLTGKSSLKYASIQLQAYGLVVGKTIYKPDPHYNLLLGMEFEGKPISKGQKLPKGSTVDLVLGDGLSGQQIRVPYLLGLTLKEAKSALLSKNLNIGALICEGSITDTSSAFVIRQEPEFDMKKTLRLGEAVDLFIAGSIPSDLIIDPSLYNLSDNDSTETTPEPEE